MPTPSTEHPSSQKNNNLGWNPVGTGYHGLQVICQRTELENLRWPIRIEVMSFVMVLIGQCWITTVLLMTRDLQTTVAAAIKKLVIQRLWCFRGIQKNGPRWQLDHLINTSNQGEVSLRIIYTHKLLIIQALQLMRNIQKVRVELDNENIFPL